MVPVTSSLSSPQALAPFLDTTLPLIHRHRFVPCVRNSEAEILSWIQRYDPYFDLWNLNQISWILSLNPESSGMWLCNKALLRIYLRKRFAHDGKACSKQCRHQFQFFLSDSFSFYIRHSTSRWLFVLSSTLSCLNLMSVLLFSTDRKDVGCDFGLCNCMRTEEFLVVVLCLCASISPSVCHLFGRHASVLCGAHEVLQQQIDFQAWTFQSQFAQGAQRGEVIEPGTKFVPGPGQYDLPSDVSASTGCFDDLPSDVSAMTWQRRSARAWEFINDDYQQRSIRM